MTGAERDKAWDELRQQFGVGEGAKQKSGVFWQVMLGMGGGEGEGLFYDALGNDRTHVVRALVERLDRTTQQVLALAERVAVLERIAVHDEARIALEIEKLRTRGG